MNAKTEHIAATGSTYDKQTANQPEENAPSLEDAKKSLLSAFEEFVGVMTSTFQASTGGSSSNEPGDGATGPGTVTPGDGGASPGGNSSGTSTSAGTGSSGPSTSAGTGSSGTGTTSSSSAGSQSSQGDSGSHGSTATTGTLQPGGKKSGSGSATGSASSGSAASSRPSKPSKSTDGSSAGTGARDSEAYARHVAGLQEAYRWDLAREATRAPRRRDATSQVPTIGSGALQNKHTRDSNTASIREEQEFAPAFGEKGRPRTETNEVLAVHIPSSSRPETAPGPVQPGMRLDAFWASNHSPMERAQERMRLVQTMTSEVVIGTDERTRVTNTAEYPYRCICSLLITASNGSQYIGTGWLVAPRVLLTAGHCVYMHDEGGWASQIEVIPGRDVDYYPYGSVIATDLRSVTGWTVDGDRDFDYGAILLPESRRLGDELGWFGYAVRRDNYLHGIDVNLSGYPGDGGPDRIYGAQWQDHRQIQDVHQRQITYPIDTYGGQSGAPVWETTPEGDRYGVAIHTWGMSTSNGATRITSDLFDNVVAWAGEVP